MRSRHFSTPMTGRHATSTRSARFEMRASCRACGSSICCAPCTAQISVEKLRAHAIVLAALLQPTFNTHDKYYPLRHHTSHQNGGRPYVLQPKSPSSEPCRRWPSAAPYRAPYTSGKPLMQGRIRLPIQSTPNDTRQSMHQGSLNAQAHTSMISTSSSSPQSRHSSHAGEGRP